MSEDTEMGAEVIALGDFRKEKEKGRTGAARRFVNVTAEGRTDFKRQVLMPQETFRTLLRDYYVAQKRVNGEFSGHISRDWRILAMKVALLSETYLKESFDFGDDDIIYGDDEE